MAIQEDDVRIRAWTTALLLLLAVFLIAGCDGLTRPFVTRDTLPVAPENETPASERQKNFTVVDETQGRGVHAEDQRFEATILVTETSDSSLVALTTELKSHYSEHLETFDEVRFFIFDDRTPASEYLSVPIEESVELNRVMIASYHLDKEPRLDVLYALEDATPRILKDFTQ